MKNIIAALALLGFSGCLTGCMTITTNQSEVGFRWGTEVTFFSRASKTSDEPATAELKSQPLNEWLASPNETAKAEEGDEVEGG